MSRDFLDICVVLFCQLKTFPSDIRFQDVGTKVSTPAGKRNPSHRSKSQTTAAKSQIIGQVFAGFAKQIIP